MDVWKTESRGCFITEKKISPVDEKISRDEIELRLNWIVRLSNVYRDVRS